MEVSPCLIAQKTPSRYHPGIIQVLSQVDILLQNLYMPTLNCLEAVNSIATDTSNQLQGFTISYGNGGSSTKLYDANGTAYGSGVFTIPINPPVIADAIIIRRLGTLTLCEVEIYGGKTLLFHLTR